MKKGSATTWIVVIIVIIIIIIIAIFASSKGSSAPATSTVNQPATTSPSNSGTITTTIQSVSTTTVTTVVLATTTSDSLGTYLVASNGMALYEYSEDAPGISYCIGTCATVWPPYTISVIGSLVGTPGMSGTIATITRADGMKQLTYNGKPLYFYKNDTKPGVVAGQGQGSFTVAKP